MNYPEQRRQHIGLSQFAYNVISSDMITYDLSERLTGFINIVIKNSFSFPFVSQLEAIKEERDRLQACLDPIAEDNPKGAALEPLNREIIKKILIRFRQDQRRHQKKYKNDVTMKILLQKDVALLVEKNIIAAQRFYSIELGQKDDIIKSYAAFLKDILETYARLPLYKREQLLFKDLINQINECQNVVSPKIYTVRYFDVDNASNGSDPIQALTMKIYRTTTEYETSRPYLLGLARIKADKGYKYVSNPICVAFIQSIQEVSIEASGIISDNAKTELDQEVAQFGFMSFKRDNVEVTFSEEGLLQYFLHPNNRPYADLQEVRHAALNNIKIIFSGAEKEIYDYFCQFSSGVVITSPTHLKKAVQGFHSNGLASYKKLSVSTIDWNQNETIINELDNIIEEIRSNPRKWEYYNTSFEERNSNVSERGIYPFFITYMAEKEIVYAYIPYAKLLFDGDVIKKDYKLSAFYYEKYLDLLKNKEITRYNKLRTTDRFNLLSIYKAGICGEKKKIIGDNILSLQRKDLRYFPYPTSDGYTFYAPMEDLHFDYRRCVTYDFPGLLGDIPEDK